MKLTETSTHSCVSWNFQNITINRQATPAIRGGGRKATRQQILNYTSNLLVLHAVGLR